MNGIIYTNGIDIDTGTYAIPPMPVDELDALIRGEKPPKNITELEKRAQRPKSLGVKEGVNEKDLCQTGWGVVFADDADPVVETALQPLLKLREDQAGERYHRYDFQVGKDTRNSFLAKQGVGPGPANPDKVPYYLLIVGSPEKIPYDFQSQLAVQYAVGRLHFRTPAEYRIYADSVVAAELDNVILPRQASLFGVTHQNKDTATNQSLKYLIDPLSKVLHTVDGWQLEVVRGEDANKETLRNRLGGNRTPALLFTASHGLLVSSDNQRKLPQTEYQGALICADWPGPGTPLVEEAFFFGGKDLLQGANLQGLIAFFFACFSAGTPQEDAYGRLERIRLGQDAGPARQLASQPFVSYLPRRMLSAPAGGALAVIGHVERTWPSSYLWLRQEDGTLPPQTEVFESTLRKLMRGFPVGAAVEYLNARYAELTAMLLPYLEAIRFGDPYDRVEFVNTWMAANDAKWYTIIGDPAVRLPVVEATETRSLPVLASISAAPAAGQAGEKSGNP